LFNPEAVIIEGIPIDSSSYDFSKSLFNACQKDETSRRMSRFPWGVHTTLIRNSGGLSPEQLEETGFYQALLKERKKFTPKTTRFKSLDVCFFDCGPKEARFRVLERFEL